MLVFYFTGHEETRRTKKNKKNRGKFCENIRTKWTGFICRRTGFIGQWTGFIRGVDEASPQADEVSKPTDETSSISLIFFFLFSSFLKCFLVVCSWSFTIRISVKKMLFLRTDIHVLNYPIK